MNKTTVNRTLSLLVSLFWLVVAYNHFGNISDTFKMIFVLLFPLAFIWFGEFFGKQLGYAGFGGSYHYIDKETPGILVAGIGWFFLTGLPIIAWLVGGFG